MTDPRNRVLAARTLLAIPPGRPCIDTAVPIIEDAQLLPSPFRQNHGGSRDQ